MDHIDRDCETALELRKRYPERQQARIFQCKARLQKRAGIPKLLVGKKLVVEKQPVISLFRLVAVVGKCVWHNWNPKCLPGTTAKCGSEPFEIALVLVRLNHIARFIANANHGMM
jgi:hypothetical protein